MVKKKHCYTDTWLWLDMDNMGYLFEYCDDMFHKAFNVWIDRTKFIKKFLVSDCRKAIDVGNGALVAGPALDIVYKYARVDLGLDFTDILENPDGLEFAYNDFQLFWVGQAYVYLHFRLDMYTEDVVKVIPFEEMLEFYWTGHQLGWAGFYDRVKWKFGIEEEDLRKH
jgi:hypothetical protein